MKRVHRLALGFALAGFVGGGDVAIAADKPVKATPVTPTPVITWTSFYAGLQTGVTKVSSRLFNDSGDYTGIGFIGGGTLGYNWQIPNSIFVLGVEGDGSWSNAETR
jgi:outer membrane immunogenic protein